jgi:nitrogen fixation NifU-like protein
MRVQIRVRDNIIIESKFQTFGSRSAVATSEYVVGLIEGKTIYEARQITSAEIIDDLSLSYNRRYCCKMAQEAISSAIRDYKFKNPLQ